MSSPSTAMRFVRGAGKLILYPLGVAGVLGAAAGAKEMKIRNEVQEDLKGDKKRVLVLPFHRMKLVEKKKPNPFEALDELDTEGKENRMIEMEVGELVKTIHAAAKDRNIVALYGIFGHGFEFSCGGLGHVDEIRQAIKVFGESKVEDDGDDKGAKKELYAYADSFGNPLDGVNKEYYIASAFNHIHMQDQGDLNLFGLYSMGMFLRSFLERYGIKVHVFKHSQYKNTPNMFTHYGYDRYHRQNVKNIIDSLDQHICDEIMESRTKEADHRLWRLIRNFGTFDSTQAKEMGFIDDMTKVDPLESWVNAAKRDMGDDKKKKKKDYEGAVVPFHATEALSLSKYSALMAKRHRVKSVDERVRKTVDQIAEASTTAEFMLRSMGFKPNVDPQTGQAKVKSPAKVALIHLTGPIGSDAGRRLVRSLRKIKKDDDIKCVVLRVDSPGGGATASEILLQECNELGKPVITSMGNVAASGGYYVASGSEKIFALPSTITGSIGVFGIKLDMSGLGQRYGVRFESIETGLHSSGYHPFRPMTPAMRANFNRNIKRVYDQFKNVVGEGRKMTTKQVETVAKGRVWTGTQAKENGLVDEIGGLHEAIEYAKLTYASDDAIIEKWPKPKSLVDRVMASSDEESFVENLLSVVLGFNREHAESRSQRAFPEQFLASLMNVTMWRNSSEPMLTLDENTALSVVFNECAPDAEVPLLPNDFWR